jgi:pentose-5-phosphate-3-epimerase
LEAAAVALKPATPSPHVKTIANKLFVKHFMRVSPNTG